MEGRRNGRNRFALQLPGIRSLKGEGIDEGINGGVSEGVNGGATAV